MRTTSIHELLQKLLVYLDRHEIVVVSTYAGRARPRRACLGLGNRKRLTFMRYSHMMIGTIRLSSFDRRRLSVALSIEVGRGVSAALVISTYGSEPLSSWPMSGSEADMFAFSVVAMFVRWKNCMRHRKLELCGVVLYVRHVSTLHGKRVRQLIIMNLCGC